MKRIKSNYMSYKSIQNSNDNSSEDSNSNNSNVRYILQQLLNQTTSVDYRKEAGLDESEQLNQKHYLVITIEKLLKTAAENEWGLCLDHETVYLYIGTHWEVVDKTDFQYFLGATALKMGVPVFDAKFHRFKNELWKQFIATANLPIPDVDEYVNLINLNNGTLELSTDGRRFREHRREDFLKYKLPFDYDEQATCPKFQAFLNEVLPDNALQNILAEYIGYVFINPKTLKLEKVLLLYGSGANGKSVIFDIIQALLGRENISNFTLESLMGYSRASISDKLLNYASEISDRLNVDLFKQMVSGEPIEARQIYGEPHTIYNYAKLMFNCNELPNPGQHKDAFFRRFIIIPFEKKIEPENQDPELANKIIADELPGILNWALAGMDRLVQKKAFTQSDKVDSLLHKYRKETDSVQVFLATNEIEPGTEKTRYLKDLYEAYRVCCKEEQLSILGKRKFSEQLQEHGFTVKRINAGMVVLVDRAETEEGENNQDESSSPSSLYSLN